MGNILAVGILVFATGLCLGAMSMVRIRPRKDDADIEAILADAERPYFHEAGEVKHAHLLLVLVVPALFWLAENL